MTRFQGRLLLLFAVLAASACALNPQPIPPDGDDSAFGNNAGAPSDGSDVPRSPPGDAGGLEASEAGDTDMDAGDGGSDADAGASDAGESDAGDAGSSHDDDAGDAE